MKITIIGAGAIGGLAGAYMTQKGHDVTLVDRWAEHVDVMNAKGLFIDGVRGEMTVKVKAATPDQLSGDLGMVLIATKSQHSVEAVTQLVPLLTPESCVVSFQNGFNEPDMIAALDAAGLPGSAMVMGSIPNYGGALVDPGYIEFVHEGPIQLGEMDGSDSARLKELGDALSALTDVQCSDHIWGQIWAKEVYASQVVFSALADARIRDTLGNERYARIAGAVVKEALEIADARGIDVQAFDFFDPANYRVKTAADTRKLLDNINHAIWLLKKDQDGKTHDFKKKGSGIWWDIVYRKRPSETRSSSGKLVDYGKEVGADTRLNEKMFEMIYEIEDGKRELGFHNFDELEAYVAECGKDIAMSDQNKLGVGVIGTHAWADKAHLPGYKAHDRVDIVAVCDVDEGRARVAAEKFGARKVYTDAADLIADPEVQMVDVCTPTHTHLPLSLDAIAAGKHVLSEKPLHTEAAPAFDAAARADRAGVRTKLGFTFRYSPAIRWIQQAVAAGELGEIYHIHGFEQNQQWLDPDYPLRQIAPDAVRCKLIPSSIVGYGSHLIDLMRWIGGEFESVVSSMKNFIPERVIRGEEGRQRVLIDDGTVGLVEYKSGAQATLQTSYIAVGNYPGVEVRVYGSKGAAIARLISEYDVQETLMVATKEDFEFRRLDLPASTLPPGTTLATPWPELYYRNLVCHFVDEILEDKPQECTFHDGAKSQEIVDAFILAHRERRWVEVGK